MHACRHRFISAVAALALGLTAGAAALAQQDADDQPAAGELDPPTRAARLSYVEGAVSVQPAGAGDWTAATINRPLTTGDQLWSDRDSLAEIQFGSATMTLADSSSLSVLDLGDQAVQLQLSAGTANIVLRDPGAAGSFEIDAPNAAVSLVRPGSYRIGVNAAGNTTVGMRDGQAQVVSSSGETVNLRGGQAAQFSPEGGIDVAALGPPDEFERWCAQRAARWAGNQYAAQYVSSDVVGAQDLDDYGEWRQEPDFGYVWYPTRIAPDWAPYRYGRWLWVSPWGWTWVNSAPWGYAPFHYGRWAYLRQRWCWVPAPARSHAVYAPALVAWVGGTAAGVAVGAGPGVGWLPLAPGEVYLPGYRVSTRYLRNVNVTNTTIVNNTYITSVYQNPQLQSRYANRDAPRALTVVSQQNFASGHSIAGHALAPPPQWQGATATPRPPEIVPARQSVLGPGGQTAVKRPSIAILNRPVIARRPPPPPPPSIDRQFDAMRANGGHALPPAQLQQLRVPESPRSQVLLPPPRKVPFGVPAPPAAAAPELRESPFTPGLAPRPGTPGTAAPPTLRTTPLAPQTPSPRASPGRPVMPVPPGTSVTPAVPATPTPPANDRRYIPERPPQYQVPPQARPPVQMSQPKTALPPPPPPPAAPPVQPLPKGKPAAPADRPPAARRGEPP